MQKTAFEIRKPPVLPWNFQEREAIRKGSWFWNRKKKLYIYDQTHAPPSEAELYAIGRSEFGKKYANRCKEQPEYDTLLELGRLRSMRV